MTRSIILVLVLIGIGAAVYALEVRKASRPTPANQPSANAAAAATAPEIARPSGFINTEPFQLADLIGKKVILVDFWTYSCINCQRTLPYLNAWHEKYKDNGLVIVGVHTPEFEFEKQLANVRAAVDKFQVRYSVVLDNEYATWQAYGNRYWPHKYLIDISGAIVYDHIGEGGYAQTEHKIQELLNKRRQVLGEKGSLAREVAKPETAVAVDARGVRSPEAYFGASRNEFLANGKAGTLGAQDFVLPQTFGPNQLFLGGKWTLMNEYATANAPGSKIVFRYQAKNVYFVAGAKAQARVRIRLDGELVRAAAGEDVVDGVVTIGEERLYSLIKGEKYDEHVLELELINGELEAYTFTFG